ncbi:hypothetical protein LNV07_00515 [Paucibacter oligotrophus]|uniref:DUF4935 domain-containing protein n=1 Tax=Roseateles oligotrophus TaxID=1769250 RepID=A0ABT2Y952_9BURK|nr:hypothetical protein [Roseateles oligotrophus]
MDTNIWSYLADHDAVDELYRLALTRGVEISVSPTIVEELRRTTDLHRRRAAVEAVTRPCWNRLMPETFSECLEIKLEIRRLRPEWVIDRPNLLEFNRLRYDWTKLKNGFWDRARRGVEPRVTDESVRGDRELALAREESKQIRQRLSKTDQGVGDTPIQFVAGLPAPGTPGWAGDPVDYWRLPSLAVVRAELLVYASPYREWIDCEIDIGCETACKTFQIPGVNSVQ